MNKKLIAIPILSVLFLSACGKEDISNYIEKDFHGINGKGSISYEIDEDKIAREIYKVTSPTDEDLEKKGVYDELEALSDIEITANKEDNLKNGEKVKLKVTVPEEIKRLKSGEKEIEVSGLKKAKVLKNDDIKSHVIPKFFGASGRGSVEIENTLPAPLSDLEFKVKNDGKLKNGDTTYLYLPKNQQQALANSEYVLENDKGLKIKVKDLDDIAKDPTKIKNYDSIIRMIDEKKTETYKKDEFNPYDYQVAEKGVFYKQFDDESSEEEGLFDSGSTNGTLVKLYHVKRFHNEDLEEEKHIAIGYTNIKTDRNNTVNVAEIEEYEKEFDENESLDTVKDLLKGYNYKEVK